MRRARSPISFGSEATRDAWLDACERQARAQSVPFAVAPMVVIHLPAGGILRSGDEVRASNLTPTPPQFEARFGSRSGKSLLIALADAGYLTQAENDGPTAA